MKVVWSEEAERDFHQIASYLIERSPAQAAQVMDRIDAAALSLAELPDRFRPGFRQDSREHVVRGLPYIMVYLVQPDYVEILSLFHTAQDKPRGG